MIKEEMMIFDIQNYLQEKGIPYIFNLLEDFRPTPFWPGVDDDPLNHVDIDTYKFQIILFKHKTRPEKGDLVIEVDEANRRMCKSYRYDGCDITDRKRYGEKEALFREIDAFLL